MTVTLEHEHLDVLTNAEASELVNTRGVAKMVIHPMGMDLQLQGGGVVAFYVRGPWEGRFRYEEWAGV